MSDETKPEVKAEDVLEVAASAETKPETKAPDVAQPAEVPVESLLESLFESPVKATVEDPDDPDHEVTKFSYKGHFVRFNEAGECFIEKDGQSLGYVPTMFQSQSAVVADAKSIIDERTEKTEGE